MELPEFLIEETEEQILARMLSKVPDDIDKNEGSYIWDALSPVAAEIAQMKIDMGEYLKRGFASSTFGPYLDYRCEEHGLKRKEATKAKGQVKFVGIEGTVIPGGTIVSTTANEIEEDIAIEFITLKEEVIPSGGYVLIDIVAAEAGSQGNVISGAINLSAVPITGITAVCNEQSTTGGTDEERDDSLLARFLSKVQAPGTSGNKADYLRWTLEVDGVGGAQVVPLWNGPSTVKVVVADSNKHAAATSLITDVVEHIEEVRPIGANVTVISAIEKGINITATVTLANGYTIGQVQNLYQNAADNYLKSIAFVDTYVSYAQLGKILLETAGVGDYSDLLINGAINNVTLTEEETPVLGTVTLEV